MIIIALFNLCVASKNRILNKEVKSRNVVSSQRMYSRKKMIRKVSHKSIAMKWENHTRGRKRWN